MVAHLRPPNLRDYLVRAKLPPVDRRQGAGQGPRLGFRRCGGARCMCCSYTADTRTHTCTSTGHTWPIKQSISCDDRNVVYSVTCEHRTGGCTNRPQYVGMVGNTRACRQQLTEHRAAVRHHQDTGVGNHFNLPGHSLDDVTFLPFEKPEKVIG